MTDIYETRKVKKIILDKEINGVDLLNGTIYDKITVTNEINETYRSHHK